MKLLSIQTIAEQADLSIRHARRMILHGHKQGLIDIHRPITPNGIGRILVPEDQVPRLFKIVKAPAPPTPEESEGERIQKLFENGNPFLKAFKEKKRLPRRKSASQ